MAIEVWGEQSLPATDRVVSIIRSYFFRPTGSSKTFSVEYIELRHSSTGQGGGGGAHSEAGRVPSLSPHPPSPQSSDYRQLRLPTTKLPGSDQMRHLNFRSPSFPSKPALQSLPQWQSQRDRGRDNFVTGPETDVELVGL